MKTILLSLCLFGSSGMFAQVFTGTPIQSRMQQLNEYFSACEVYALDGKSLHRFITSDSGSDRIQLVLGEKAFSWRLEENNMIRPETRGTTISNGEYVPLQFDRTCITYKAISETNHKVERTIKQRK